MMKRTILFAVLSLYMLACMQPKKTSTLFTKLSTDQTGVTFSNQIVETEELHYYDYLHLFNGAGVGVADFDGDGLMDLIFSANTSGCKLYRNKGNMQFEDITEKATLDQVDGFVTGVSIGDVNADGLPDIYLSRSGWYSSSAMKQNILLVNQGDFNFKEDAVAYGIADAGHSINATFFDYDKDGWLDLYVVNTPVDFTLVGKIYDLEDIKTNPYTLQFGSTDHLYKNNGNNTFTDVTARAGLFNEIGFGLNAQVGDLNNDGWMDLYISNDFISPDFAFVNQQDGTFKEVSKELFGHISYNSMGADLSDINNDGHNDLIVVDMSPADYKRSKTTMSMTDRNRFKSMTTANYHNQYMHNMLQRNNGDGTFSEISQLAGVDKTDWSWAPLFADFDNDGMKDLFISNGVLKDVQDRDTDRAVKKIIEKKKINGTLKKKDFLELSKMLPSVPLANYVYQNKGDMQFEDKVEDWGFSEPTFTNGAAYADLDNDGDLDLVLNNINGPASIYRNGNKDNQSLTVSLKGSHGNQLAIGARVELWANGGYQTKELILSRGYMSTVDPRVHFGLGAKAKMDSLKITWPDGKISTQYEFGGEQFIHFDQREASSSHVQMMLTSNSVKAKKAALYEHKEIVFDDFDKQVLLPHKLSQLGPALAVADVNGDGLDDFFVGGAHQFKSAIFIQNNAGEYERTEQQGLEKDARQEDISATFFDADGDGDQDLVVGAGSYEFEREAKENQDRLYINDGNGNFSRTNYALPKYVSISSTLVPFDFDSDGDLDLFVGNRVIPGEYPRLANSILLENTGKEFVIAKPEQQTMLSELGLVTGAKALDYNQDGRMDLVIVGEWMALTILVNENGLNEKIEVANSKGWWNAIEIADVDNDGYQDIVAGNLGLNYKFHASPAHPFNVLSGDFDQNGSYDLMLAKEVGDDLKPIRGRSCSSEQMPSVQAEFPTYNAFADADVFDIIGGQNHVEQHLEVQEFRSGIFYGNADGIFTFKAFPLPLQISPINGLALVTSGKNKVLISAGNLYESEVETTRADAGFGNCLKIESNRSMSVLNREKTNILLGGNVKGLCAIRNESGRDQVIAAVNDGPLKIQTPVLPN